MVKRLLVHNYLRKVGMKNLCLSKNFCSLLFGALLCLTSVHCFAMEDGGEGAEQAGDAVELRSLIDGGDAETGGTEDSGSSLARRKGAILCSVVVAGLVVTGVAAGMFGAGYFNSPSTPQVPPSKGTSQTPMMNLDGTIVLGLNSGNGGSAEVGIAQVTPDPELGDLGDLWYQSRALQNIKFWDEWGRWDEDLCYFFNHHWVDGWCKKVPSLPQTFEWTIPSDDENNVLAVGYYDPTKDDCQPRCVIRYKPGQRTGLKRGLPPSACRRPNDCKEYMRDLVAQCAIDPLKGVACVRKGNITKAMQKLQTKRELRDRYPSRVKRALQNRPGKNGR